MSTKDPSSQPEVTHCSDPSQDKGSHSDAKQIEAELNLSLWKNIKLHKRVLLYCVAPFCAGMTFGYDSIVNGASISMPAFLIYFGAVSDTGALYLPSIWTSLWTAMSALSQAIGGLGIGLVSDSIGRKWCCVLASIVSLGGVALQYFAETRAELLGGKMLNGLAIGCLTATSTAWASEVMPPQLRGPIQSAIVLFTVIMQAIGLLVVRLYASNMEETAFRHVFAIQFAGAGLTAVTFALVPESPPWLVLKGKLECARKTFAQLNSTSGNLKTRFSNLCKDIQQEQATIKSSGTSSYLVAFQGSNLKRSLTVCWLFIGVGLNGASLLSQNVYFLIIAGLPAVHSYDVGIGGFGLAMIAIVGSWVYMDRLGRRSLFLVGVAGNILVMLVIGCLYYAHNKASLWAIAVLMNILLSWQIVTMVSPGWAITGEISSYSMRGKTQSIAVIAQAFATWFFTFTVPYIYNTDAGNLGARAGFVFMGSSVLLLAVSFFVIPDLRNFTTQEIDWLYENKISVRKFQDYADGLAKQGVEKAAMEAGTLKAPC